MTKPLVITCVAGREPYSHLSSFSVFGVQLNFESRQEKAGNGKDDFEDFLKDILKCKFGAYKLSGSTLTRVDELVILDGAPTGQGVAVMAWLDRAPTGNDPAWSGAPPENGVIDQNMELHAGIRLAGAQTWPAPLPQEAGLTRLLAPTKNLHSGTVYIVPFPYGDPIPTLLDAIVVPKIPPRSDMKTLKLESPWGDDRPALEVSILTVDPVVEGIDKNGFLLAGNADPEALSILGKIRNNGGGITWTTPQMIALAWDPKPDDGVLDGGVVPEDARHKDALRRLVWRTSQCLASLLDSFFLALTMGEQTKEGEEILRLGPILLAALAEADEIDEPSADRERAFVVNVREWVAGQHADWGAYIDQLAQILLRPNLAKFYEENNDFEAYFGMHLKTYLASDSEVEILPFFARLAEDDWAGFDPSIKSFDSAEIEAKLDQELSELMQILGHEDSFENCVLEFFRGAKPLKDGPTFLESLFYQEPDLANISQLPESEREAEISDRLAAARASAQDKARRAIKNIAELFSSGYNGLEAARQAAGEVLSIEFLKSATKPTTEGAPPEKIEAEGLRKLLLDEDWFVVRTKADPSVDSAFASLLNFLPASPMTLVSGEPIDGELVNSETLTDFDVLKAAWIEACAEFGVSSKSVDRRFTTHTHPHEMPVYLPLPHVPQRVDPFEQFYDGVGLLVRQKTPADVDAKKWAHANLVQFSIDGRESSKNIGILPLQPAISDGVRQISFDYSGRLFAFDQDGEFGDESKFSSPYFRVALPDYKNSDSKGFAKMPPLAYGITYEFQAYAVSRNGVMPKGVSTANSGPDLFIPAVNPAVEAAQIPVPFVYNRKTGIGRMILQRDEKYKEDLSKRNDGFMSGLRDVRPLTADYPRVGITASDGQESWLDLWRRSDGSGSIAVHADEKASVELSLKDVAEDGTGELFISLLSSAAPDREEGFNRLEKLKISDLKDVINFEIKFEKAADNGNWVHRLYVDGKEHHQVAGAKLVWIRLLLEAAPGKMASVTFAEPQGEAESVTTGGKGLPADFLLLRPPSDETLGTNEEVWKKDYQSQETMKLLPPSMGVVDLDRWLSNPVLFKAAGGVDVGEGPIGKLQEVLLAATLGGDPDAAEILEKYAGSLPDLAVDYIVAELTVTNKIADKNLGAQAVKAQIISLPNLAKLITDAGGITNANLAIFLEKLADIRRFDVKLSVGTGKASITTTDKAIEVSIPPGHTAQLRLRPAVSDSHFDSEANGDDKGVIAKGLLGYTSGTREINGQKYHLFDGPSLTLEAMDLPDATIAKDLRRMAEGKPNPADTANKVLFVEAQSGVRTYNVVFKPLADDLVWHWCATAEFISQRWRHLGRPIDNWFNPRRPKRAQTPILSEAGPILSISRSVDVRRFEEDAFDREDGDSQSQIVALEPVGEKSTLHSGEWEVPSATIFRHRISLRNRYAGALCHEKHRSWEIVGPDKDSHEDWLRIVVLADRQRVQLSRPQLRVLMPLNRTTGDEKSPPLLAMLAEPPFGTGGLADRIGSGVATGFGYAMKKAPGDTELLGIQDSRQEFGRDPVLSYFDLDEKLHQRISLRADGPIGLTHDNVTNSSAAFSNSSWLLSPVPLPANDGNEDLQEHFSAVSMRRYLDPHWLTRTHDESAGARAEVKRNEVTEKDEQLFRFADTLWFEVTKKSCVLSHAHKEVLEVKWDDQDFTVSVMEKNILPSLPTIDNKLEVAKFGGDHIYGCKLLHQPLDDGRASMSVFADMGDNIPPRMMASFEWVSSGQGDLSVEPVTVENVFITSASLPTDAEWARTGRNVESVSVSHSPDGTSAPAEIADLTLPIGKAEFVHEETTVWLRPSLHDAPSPLHLQRCLAGLPTIATGSTAQAMETYSHDGGPARLLLGKHVSVEGTTADSKLRVMELEFPAKPLGFVHGAGVGEAPIPPEYSKPTFDLDEFGMQNGHGLLALIRPTGTSRNLRNGKLCIDFEAFKRMHKFEINLADSKALDQILIFVRNGDANVVDGDKQMACWLIKQDGKTCPSTDVPSDEATMAPPNLASFSVRIEGAESEWWGNVAILPIAAKPDDVNKIDVDFSWFFGATSDEEMDKALSHSGLKKAKAAWARIISVSPPIGTSEE